MESEALSKVPEYQSLVSEKQRLEASLQDMAKQRESQLANDPRLKRAQAGGEAGAGLNPVLRPR